MNGFFDEEVMERLFEDRIQRIQVQSKSLLVH